MARFPLASPPQEVLNRCTVHAPSGGILVCKGAHEDSDYDSFCCLVMKIGRVHINQANPTPTTLKPKPQPRTVDSQVSFDINGPPEGLEEVRISGRQWWGVFRVCESVKDMGLGLGFFSNPSTPLHKVWNAHSSNPKS